MKKKINYILVINIIMFITFVPLIILGFTSKYGSFQSRLVKLLLGIDLTIYIMINTIICIYLITKKGLGKIELKEYKNADNYPYNCLFEKKENKKETFFGRLTKSEISSVIIRLTIILSSIIILTIHIVNFTTKTSDDHIYALINGNLVLCITFIDLYYSGRKANIIKRNKIEETELELQTNKEYYR